ncbi:hypothetical protein E6O75_ATG02590 [Venturia nashicola]|uniref:Uncharacterized protein n=1 Tax=Venturia nashicola TaxID=86259 RepID=A0A4Z1P7G5_9PEZI|nr:hypothetical protein E6O75_ATG02590 [Venturia nashicola]
MCLRNYSGDALTLKYVSPSLSNHESNRSFAPPMISAAPLQLGAPVLDNLSLPIISRPGLFLADAHGWSLLRATVWILSSDAIWAVPIPQYMTTPHTRGLGPGRGSQHTWKQTRTGLNWFLAFPTLSETLNRKNR